MGYQTISLKTGLNLVSTTFDDISGGVADIQDFLSVDFLPNEELLFYKPGGGYDRYLYSDNLMDAAWNDLNRPGWGNMSGQEVAIPLPPNKAFWIYTANPSIEIQIDSPLQ